MAHQAHEEQEMDLSGIDYDAILSEVDEVRSKRGRVPAEQIATQHATLKEMHPRLFDMCLAERFDRAQLEVAIGLLKRVQRGELDGHDAARAFGESVKAKHEAAGGGKKYSWRN